MPVEACACANSSIGLNGRQPLSPLFFRYSSRFSGPFSLSTRVGLTRYRTRRQQFLHNFAVRGRPRCPGEPLPAGEPGFPARREKPCIAKGPRLNHACSGRQGGRLHVRQGCLTPHAACVMAWKPVDPGSLRHGWSQPSRGRVTVPRSGCSSGFAALESSPGGSAWCGCQIQ